MKTYLKGLVKDIIPVILGVLIALIINSWNDARKDRVYVDNFYTSLKKEFSEAVEEIDRKAPFQRALFDTLGHYSTNEELTLMEVIRKAGGIKGPSIKLNYWKAISDSKIELIAYHRLSILADIEDGNDILLYQRNKILDFIYEHLDETGSREKMILRQMLGDVMSTQTSIKQDILEILNE